MQPVRRTATIRKGEREHIFMKAPQLEPLVSLLVLFVEVQGEKASLYLGQPQKPLSFCVGVTIIPLVALRFHH